ncbi:hypothetical protein JG688_00018019 [Phytophthora aleatoria]|uniref:Uncharacterized protein n=1 Tax=Phytophthora aleatoria TaxID=2496075 RepID=A0A8J5IWK3_9STRA|nr:hypothetical protein JG688_00018019 [Phytophthora aleatoria]
MADLRHEKDHKVSVETRAVELVTILLTSCTPCFLTYYQLRLPDKTHASNGKPIYRSGAFDRAVSYFCCDTKIEFDTLYPVYLPDDNRVRHCLRSSM